MTASGTSPRMRVIGMLGGMSWESSAQYYRLVNELTRERLGGLHSARLVLVSVDFAEIEQLQVTGQWERAGELLAEAAKSAEAAGAELLLVCTNTMHKVAGRDRLAHHGLTVLVPPAEDRALVHRVIYSELCLGEVREASRQAYQKVIDRLKHAGAEGVILGCTEIELLIQPKDSPIPVFATTQLHVEAAIEQALAPSGR
jgi:aspartate racemase